MGLEDQTQVLILADPSPQPKGFNFIFSYPLCHLSVKLALDSRKSIKTHPGGKQEIRD